LNTGTFDRDGVYWFTGQSGIYGRLDPRSGEINVWEAPRGPGPYGIAATPEGDIYYASLAGNHIAKIEKGTGAATVVEPPTKGQGARRVWSDSKGRIWVSEWNAGQLARYDPKANSWREWKLPGDRPKAYAVYVDDRDIVWVSDWAPMRSCRLIPRRRRSGAIPPQRLGRTCARSSGVQAKSGCRNPGWTASW
jgi:virginiamycin B lyase